MYGKPRPAVDYGDFPEGGGYPNGFVEWALETMGCDDPAKVLHVCAGSVQTGITVDIRPEKKPTVVADGRHLPFADDSFDFILLDPPYAESYAEMLYGTGKVYPKPTELVMEAARVAKLGGKIGLLHFVVPYTRRPVKIRGVWGATTGNGSAIRAWTLMEKVDPALEKWKKGSRGDGRTPVGLNYRKAA